MTYIISRMVQQPHLTQPSSIMTATYKHASLSSRGQQLQPCKQQQQQAQKQQQLPMQFHSTLAATKGGCMSSLVLNCLQSSTRIQQQQQLQPQVAASRRQAKALAAEEVPPGAQGLPDEHPSALLPEVPQHAGLLLLLLLLLHRLLLLLLVALAGHAGVLLLVVRGSL